MKQVKAWVMMGPCRNMIDGTIRETQADCWKTMGVLRKETRAIEQAAGYRVVRCTITVDEPQAGRKG